MLPEVRKFVERKEDFVTLLYIGKPIICPEHPQDNYIITAVLESGGYISLRESFVNKDGNIEPASPGMEITKEIISKLYETYCKNRIMILCTRLNLLTNIHHFNTSRGRVAVNSQDS